MCDYQAKPKIKTSEVFTELFEVYLMMNCVITLYNLSVLCGSLYNRSSITQRSRL